jgi:hypothetical protein
MIQVKMFFDSEFDKLEETARKWIHASEGIGEVINVSQCECTDPKTTARGVLLTILYREKKGARGQDAVKII